MDVYKKTDMGIHKMAHYQEGYSLINPDVLESRGRLRKAEKIQRVFNEYKKNIPLGGILLDIGCSGGIIISHISIPCTHTIGIDIDSDALKIAHSNIDNVAIDFICADGMHLPFHGDSIGVVLCNHVYEHLPDSGMLFAEIFRVLKPGGVCYCAAGNALSVIEGHYHLPFLSWVPKRLAHQYLRIAGRGDYYYEKHLTWWQLRKKLSKFIIHDYTISIIRDPETFSSTDMIQPGSMVSRLPEWFLKYFYPLLPTWILMLEKP